MNERNVTVQTPDGPMQAYVASPDQQHAPGVVVIQEAFGVNDHIRDVTRRFAKAGYLAIAPEIFHRTAPGQSFPYNDFAAARPHMAALSNEGITSDIQATLDFLRPQTNGKVGVVGFCVGGLVTFIAATRTSTDASVSFYPGGVATDRPMFPHLRSPLAEAGQIRKPILALFGENDQGIPLSDVEKVRAALGKLPVAHDVVAYPEANHAFFCDDRSAYHAASAADAWQRTLSWFGQFLK